MAFSLSLLAVCLAFAATNVAAKEGSCFNPVQKNLKFIGKNNNQKSYQQSWTIAQYVCCHNTAWAEHWGFLADKDVSLFSKMNPAPTKEKPWVFYDSTCGLPLFKVPVSRSLKDWQTESMRHGWPSFHDDETFLQNVVELPGGEMKSKCGTHLGHNLPDVPNVNRYCIDLVCIAGRPQKKKLPAIKNSNIVVVHERNLRGVSD